MANTLTAEDLEKWKIQWLGRGHLSKHTLRWFGKYYTVFENFLARHKYVISNETMNAYVREVNEIYQESMSNLSRARNAASSFVSFLVDEGVITGNFKKILYMKSPQPIANKEVSDIELAKLDSKANASDKMIIQLFLMTCMRLDEATNIKRKDVKWDAENEHYDLYIRRGKGGKARTVGMTQNDTFDEWYRTAHADDYLFKAKDGDRASNQIVYLRLNRLSKRAGLDRVISPHVLRHRGAQNLYKKSKDIHMVSHYLGHASVDTTMIYLKKGVELKDVMKYMKDNPEEEDEIKKLLAQIEKLKAKVKNVKEVQAEVDVKKVNKKAVIKRCKMMCKEIVQDEDIAEED